MKRLGPELKMPGKLKPGMKVPPFLSDLYYDLRERRLLPVLALIVVGIVAVPFLLSSSEAPELEVSPVAPAGGATSTASRAASLTVVQAKPGLRDYHKRLAGRTPTDPFKQRFTGPVLKGARLQGETTSTTPTTTVTTTSSGESESGGSGTTVSTPPSTSPAPHKHGELTLFSWAINVKITKAGGKGRSHKKPEPTVRKNVLPQTQLPGEKAPVVTYMGPAKGKNDKYTGKALLLVSDQVRSVFGEGHCVTGEEVCQLLEVEPGFPETFVYGENETHYTVNVLKIGLIITARKKYSREARIFAP